MVALYLSLRTLRVMQSGSMNPYVKFKGAIHILHNKEEWLGEGPPRTGGESGTPPKGNTNWYKCYLQIFEVRFLGAHKRCIYLIWLNFIGGGSSDQHGNHYLIDYPIIIFCCFHAINEMFFKGVWFNSMQFLCDCNINYWLRCECSLRKTLSTE